MFLLNKSRLLAGIGGCENILANASVSFSYWATGRNKNHRSESGIFRVFEKKRENSALVASRLFFRTQVSNLGIVGGENSSTAPPVLPSRRQQRAAEAGLLVSAPESAALLARTRVIADPTQCREVVDSLIALGRTIQVGTVQPEVLLPQ